MVEGVEDHGFDLLVGEAVGGLDFDLGLLAAALFARADVEDAVGVDEEFDFDAGQAGDHGRNAFEVEAGEGAAVFGEFALALEDVDGDVGLAVDAGGEVLGGGGGDGGVALDDFGDDAAEGFDAERERGDVEEQQVVGGGVRAAGEDLRLHGGAEGYDFVGIEFGVGLACRGLRGRRAAVDEGADGGDARAAADHDDFVDLVGVRFASLRACLTGAAVRWMTGAMSCSNWSRVISRA